MSFKSLLGSLVGSRCFLSRSLALIAASLMTVAAHAEEPAPAPSSITSASIDATSDARIAELQAAARVAMKKPATLANRDIIAQYQAVIYRVPYQGHAVPGTVTDGLFYRGSKKAERAFFAKANPPAAQLPIMASVDTIKKPCKEGQTNRAGLFYLDTSQVIQTSQPGSRMHPILGIERMHFGYDDAVPKGTCVIAAQDGVVYSTQKTDNGGYGIHMVVKFGDDYAVRFGHLSKIMVNPGQTVKAGTLLAFTGSTGLSTGPHLHWEIVQRNAENWDLVKLRGRNFNVALGTIKASFNEQTPTNTIKLGFTDSSTVSGLNNILKGNPTATVLAQNNVAPENPIPRPSLRPNIIAGDFNQVEGNFLFGPNARINKRNGFAPIVSATSLTPASFTP